MGDDPCCWLDGFPRPSTVAIGGVHTSLFMSEAELARQLIEVREKGFDEPFALFSAMIFSSFQYPAENLAAARMHAFYLRLALERLTDTEGREVLFHEAVKGDRMEAAFRDVTCESYEAALESGRPFCEIFVENWCRHWAEEDR